MQHRHYYTVMMLTPEGNSFAHREFSIKQDALDYMTGLRKQYGSVWRKRPADYGNLTSKSDAGYEIILGTWCAATGNLVCDCDYCAPTV